MDSLSYLLDTKTYIKWAHVIANVSKSEGIMLHVCVCVCGGEHVCRYRRCRTVDGEESTGKSTMAHRLPLDKSVGLRWGIPRCGVVFTVFV